MVHAVYRFTCYNVMNDETRLARRFSTLDTIRSCGGTALLDTRREVDDRCLDDNGFVRVDPE